VEKRTLYQWFEDTALRFPDSPALEVTGEIVTYAALRAMASALAERVVAVRGGAVPRISLFAGRELPDYVAYLAIQRLGACVVPLHPGHPEPLLLDLVTRARVEVVIADPVRAEMFNALPRRRRPAIVPLTVERDAPPAAPAALPGVPDDGDSEAYLLFTSGSTGTPKGVPIRHRHIVPYVAHNIGLYGLGADCRMSQSFGMTFDPSVFDLFGAWGAGATLVATAEPDLYRPVDHIVRDRLTHWSSVPSVIRVARQLGNLPLGQATTLRHSVFGAEPLTVGDVELWRRVAPNSEIRNVYGPTELAITCTQHQLSGPAAPWFTGSNGTVPIGTVYPHLEGVVIDEDGLPAQEGELCVRGSQRFDGYLDPRENIGRFVEYSAGSPAVGYDGRGPLTEHHWYRTGDQVRWEEGGGPPGAPASRFLVHCGRLDDQVQVSGHRVETGEVEAAMRRHPAVTEAAVVPVTDKGETWLAAAHSGAEVSEQEIQQWLRSRLPAHMLPRRVQHVDLMPLNDNGKTDRAAVAAMFGEVATRAGGTGS
jgi:amino acid adenylation domain-containing protein